jgi:hypothetical protein
MKKWWMWWMVGLLGMVGCNASEQERMIGPYSLNEQEERIMNLTATAPGAVQVFQVTPEQGTIDVKIDHYQAGQHQGIQLTGSKLSLGKDGLVSFGLRELSNPDHHYREWFIGSQSGYLTATQEVEENAGAMSAYAAITDTVKLSHREYQAVGALIRDYQNKGINALPLDDNDSLDEIIQANDEVYLFLCKWNDAD